MVDKKIKILWLSDSPLTSTGYGTMTLNILNGMTEKGIECHCICHNQPGQTLKPGIKFMDDTEIKFHLHGAGVERYSKDKVKYLLQELKPDYFVTLLDTFMITEAGFLGMNFSPAKSIFYFPSDGEDQLPLSCEKLFTSGTYQYPIAMAKFGQQQVKKAHNIDALYIPHAVKHKLFRPYNDKEKVKNRLKWSNKLGVDLSKKQIIGTVARNQGRKMMDRMIPIMKLIAAKNENAVMLMHTDPFDRAGYFDMMYEIKKHNLENKFIFTGLNFLNPYTYTELSEIYNLMDIFLLTTTGEGFGVPIIEAMSCKVPCVVTDYTTTKELVLDHNSGLGIIVSAEIMGTWNVKRGVCDIEDGANKCLFLLSNDKLRTNMGENGRKAVLKYYTWDKVLKDWYKLFNKLKGDY